MALTRLKENLIRKIAKTTTTHVVLLANTTNYDKTRKQSYKINFVFEKDKLYPLI